MSLVDIGGVKCILLSGYKGFKEAFVEQADIFPNRPSYPLNEKLCKGQGMSLKLPNEIIKRHLCNSNMFVANMFVV